MRIQIVGLIGTARATVANKYATFLKSEYVWRQKRRYSKQKQKPKKKLSFVSTWFGLFDQTNYSRHQSYFLKQVGLGTDPAIMLSS